MGYDHCEKHNENATNGCASCEREEIDSRTDAQCIEMALIEFSPHGQLSEGYKKALSDRLRAIVAAPERPVRCQTCPFVTRRRVDGCEDVISIFCAFFDPDRLILSWDDARGGPPGFCPLPVRLRYG